MRRLGVLALAWTVFVLAVILFWPWRLPDVLCAHTVGASQSEQCLALQAQASDMVLWLESVPGLAMFAAGYLVIGWAVARQRARRQT